MSDPDPDGRPLKLLAQINFADATPIGQFDAPESAATVRFEVAGPRPDAFPEVAQARVASSKKLATLPNMRRGGAIRPFFLGSKQVAKLLRVSRFPAA